MTERRETVSLWRNRDFTLWWSGTALSELGTGITGIALPLLVLWATGSASRAGLVGACEYLGLIAGLLPAGVIADRYSRRALLVGSSLVQLAAVGTVFGAVLDGRVWLVHVSVVALVQGLASAVHSGASATLTKRIVPEAQLKTAFARDQARNYAAQLAGSPLGGVLYAAARWLPFLADAVSYAGVTLAALLIRTPLGPDRETRDRERTPLRQELTGGLRFIRGNAFLRYTVAWSATANLLFSGLAFLFVVALREHGADPATIGGASSLVTACGLVGALTTEPVLRRVSGLRIVRVMSWMLVASTIALALLPGRPWLAALGMGAAYVFLTPLNVAFNSHLVAVIPDALMGRVMTSLSMATQCIRWTAPLACGALADAFDPSVPILGISAVLALVAVANHLAPAVRELDSGPAQRSPASKEPTTDAVV